MSFHFFVEVQATWPTEQEAREGLAAIEEAIGKSNGELGEARLEDEDGAPRPC